MPSNEAPSSAGTVNKGALIARGDPRTAQLVKLQTGISKQMLLLISNFVDDSGSIATYRNEDAVIEGNNLHIAKMKLLKAQMLMRTRFMNGEALFDWCAPEDTVEMNRRNYRPVHGTPLYDQSVDFLQDEVLQKFRELDEQGRRPFTISNLFTDGEDTGSRGVSADDVKRVVDPMLQSGRHIVMGTGVEGAVDIYRVFRSMGVPEQWINVIARNDIAGSYRQAADLTDVASQSEADFTATSETGFGPSKKRRPRKP